MRLGSCSIAALHVLVADFHVIKHGEAVQIGEAWQCCKSKSVKSQSQRAKHLQFNPASRVRVTTCLPLSPHISMVEGLSDHEKQWKWTRAGFSEASPHIRLLTPRIALVPQFKKIQQHLNCKRPVRLLRTKPASSLPHWLWFLPGTQPVQNDNDGTTVCFNAAHVTTSAYVQTLGREDWVERLTESSLSALIMDALPASVSLSYVDNTCTHPILRLQNSHGPTFKPGYRKLTGSTTPRGCQIFGVTNYK